jgi:hypothetical protein
VALPGRVGIFPNAFNRDEALPCRLVVRSKMACEQFSDQG